MSPRRCQEGHVHNDEHDAGAVADVEHGVSAQAAWEQHGGGSGDGDGNGGQKQQAARRLVGLRVERLLGEVETAK